MSISSVPVSLHKAFLTLSEDQQETFLAQYKSSKKSVLICYLWFVMLGAHYAYLNKTALLLAYWVTFGGCFVWLIADIFRIPFLVRDHNKKIALEIMQKVKIFEM